MYIPNLASNLGKALILLVLLSIGATTSLAQSYLGSIAGTVKDSNGAIVKGATVSVTNDSTGQKRETTTTDSGNYVIPNLAVGDYTVSVTATGFSEATIKAVKISVASTKETDITLSPSGVAASVTVSSSDVTTSVNTTDQQLSTLIDNKKILDLPLLSRDPNSLVLLAPGTVQSNGIGGVVINGQRERNNNFMVDGVDNNDTDVPGILGGAATPSIDATEEFRVITNNFNAEFGRNSGGIITVATKSGTNAFHGGAYIFYRSDAFNARNFFDKTGKASPQQRRQYGGKVGGPIIKEKTFFFFNVERDVFDQGLTLVTTVPTANARLGIFNYTFNGVAKSINANTTNNKYGIPRNANITAFLNALYPLPNDNGKGALPGVFENYRFGTQTNDRNTNVSSKIEHRFNSRHSLAGSFNYSKGQYEFCCETFPGLNDAILSPQKGYVLSLNFNSIITSTLTNEFRFGFNRLNSEFNGAGDGGVSTSVADAVKKAVTSSGGAAGNNAFGGANGSVINFVTSGIVSPVSFDSQYRKTGTITIADNVTKVQGNHIFKGGFETRLVSSDGASNFSRQESLNFNYPTSFGDTLLTGVGLSGAEANVQNFTSFLYGLVAFQTQSQYFDKAGKRRQDDFHQYRQHEVDFFFQDNWKFRSNLSLNYGLRYEYKSVPYEKNGLLSTLVDQDPSGPTPAGGFVFKAVGKNSDNPGLQLWQTDKNNFAPRVGFAYGPDFKNDFLKLLIGESGKVSFRGGFGIFYDRVFGNLFSNTSSNPPFQRDVFEIYADTLDVVTRPTTQVTSPVAVNGDELLPVIFALPGNNKLQSKFATPYKQGWNFGMQRQFGQSILFEADYVGAKSNHLLRAIDGNMTSVTKVNLTRAANAQKAIDPNSTRTNYLNGSYNTAFNTASLNLANGNSSYHSGQFRFTKRLSGEHKLGTGEFQASYTIAHSIDDAADPLVAQTGERSFPRDSSGYVGGFKAEKGNSGSDIRHTFVGNMVYDIPVKFGNKIINNVLGNWTVSGIWTATSGRAYTIYGFSDSAGTGVGQRANFVGTGGITVASGNDPRTQTGPTSDQFLSPGLNKDGTTNVSQLGKQGNTGRGAFYGPGFNKVDFSLIKRVAFGTDARYKFKIQADFFNLFNNVNFGQPVNTISSANFGQSTGVYSARIIQFAARFDF